MTPRERVLTALRGGVPDRIPKQIDFTPGARDKFEQNSGGDDPAAFFDLEIRGVGLAPTKVAADFSVYHRQLPEGASIGEWGVARVPGSTHHFVHMVFPMADFTSVEQVEAYPFPDVLADYRYEPMRERIEQTHAEGLAALAFVTSHNYVAAWQLRGLEAFLADMMTNSKFAEAIIDRTTELSCGMVTQFAEAGLDVIVYGEDIATQRGLVMSPSMWREWLKPRLKRVIDAAHAERPDVLFVYHSDGDVQAVIPDLIEVGIDVLNPMQPECMDLERIAREYGSEVAFWGGISVQQTMPWGTPEDVRNEVRHCIETLGKDGGYLIAPSHTIEPEVPWANVKAFRDAVAEFGDYEGDR